MIIYVRLRRFNLRHLYINQLMLSTHFTVYRSEEGDLVLQAKVQFF